MSYDLYFYKKANSSFTEEKFAEYLRKSFSKYVTESNDQWIYENPETGVYFIIDWNEPNTDEEDLQLYDKFEGFINLNFSININFCRPDFFGLEIFPLVYKIVEENDLWLLNPQDSEDSDKPRKFSQNYLNEQWCKINNGVSLDNFKEFNLKFFDPNTSKYIWEYQLMREELQNSLIEDIFVAGYLLLESKKDGLIYSSCVWPEHIAIIIPPVDFVIVKQKLKVLFGIKESTGLVSYDLVMNQLGSFFEPFEHPLPGIKVLRPQKMSLIAKQFNELKIQSAVSAFGKGIGFDAFVNVKP